MKLRPLSDLAYRRRKVIKHVFDKAERWWKVYGDLLTWTRDWNVLRGAGVFGVEDDAEAVDAILADNGSAAEVLDTHHDHWVDAAGRACDEADRARRVFPGHKGRTVRIGDRGEFVVTDGDQLVTCFRVVPPTRTPTDAQRVANAVRKATRSEAAVRSAVRNHARRASCSPDRRSHSDPTAGDPHE